MIVVVVVVYDVLMEVVDVVVEIVVGAHDWKYVYSEDDDVAEFVAAVGICVVDDKDVPFDCFPVVAANLVALGDLETKLKTVSQLYALHNNNLAARRQEVGTKISR